MTKYEGAKYLVQLKARIIHTCDKCGKEIKVREFYYKEKVDMRPPPSLILRDFCKKCIEQ
jgi:hypothetical protein